MNGLLVVYISSFMYCHLGCFYFFSCSMVQLYFTEMERISEGRCYDSMCFFECPCRKPQRSDCYCYFKCVVQLFLELKWRRDLQTRCKGLFVLLKCLCRKPQVQLSDYICVIMGEHLSFLLLQLQCSSALCSTEMEEGALTEAANVSLSFFNCHWRKPEIQLSDCICVIKLKSFDLSRYCNDVLSHMQVDKRQPR